MMWTTLWARSFRLGALSLALTGSPALATPLVSGPVAPNPDAAIIANLTDTYLKASIGATTMGDWLDAAAAGNNPNRGQSLIVPSGEVVGPNPGQVTIDKFNNSGQAIVHFFDGVNSGSLNTFLTQFEASYTSGATTVSLDAFCIDLLHEVTKGQTYAVTPRDDLDAAFANGARMAFIMENFGRTDLSGNDDQAAAVQIALWDLLLNHNPTSFGLDSDGTYSSGDENVFSVDFRGTPVAEPSPVSTMLAGLILLGAWGAARRVQRVR